MFARFLRPAATVANMGGETAGKVLFKIVSSAFTTYKSISYYRRFWQQYLEKMTC